MEGELRLPFLLSTIMFPGFYGFYMDISEDKYKNPHLRDYLMRNVIWHLGRNDGSSHGWPCYAWFADDANVNSKDMLYWMGHGFCPVWMITILNL